MFIIKKIGIYGGTFNPPHIGHLLLAETAREELMLDRVIFMTGGNPPHKDNDSVADKYDRFEMTRLLIEGNEYFSVSDYEIKKTTPSYTAETLLEVKKVFSEDELFFIVGYDSLYDMKGWFKPEIIFKNATIAVALRGDASEEGTDRIISEYEKNYGARIVRINMPPIGISSSEIRKRVKEKKSIKYMTAEKVKRYIEEKGFYK